MTIRQIIVDAIEAALKRITIANGFNTNAGNNVHVWRSAPFAVEELPGIILRDLDEPTEEHTRYAERHQRSLHIQIEVLASGTTSAAEYRLLLADVEKAIKSGKLADGSWWANSHLSPGDQGYGEGMAYKHRPRISRMVAEQNSNKIAGGFHESFVDYITQDFDSYAA